MPPPKYIADFPTRTQMGAFASPFGEDPNEPARPLAGRANVIVLEQTPGPADGKKSRMGLTALPKLEL